MSKVQLEKYRCDQPGCAQHVTVPQEDEMQPHDWLIVDAWVIGAGSGTQHFCPECKSKILVALHREPLHKVWRAEPAAPSKQEPGS